MSFESDIILKNIDSHSIIVTDLQGVITFVNTGATKVFGYSKEELLGNTPAILYPDVDMASLAADLSKIMEGIDYVGQWQGKHKDGSNIFLDIKTTLLKGEDGSPQGFIGFANDITQRAKGQEEIARKNQDIKEVLEQKVEFKTQFLEQMSHELRTPLNGILGMLDIIELTCQIDPMMEPHLNTIKRSSTQLLNTVNDLLDISRMESGNLELKIKPNILGVSLKEVKSKFDNIALEKGLRLEVNIPDHIVEEYMFDKVRMHQLLSNLVSNALKFTEEGSVEIYFKDLGKGKFRIGVKDTGSGIDPNKVDILFEKYAQLENAAKKIKEGSEFGTGLGLNIVQSLLYLMDSKLEIESEVGKGSDFYFEMSLQSISEFEAGQDDIATVDFGGKKVLLVEDKMVNQMVAKLMLESFNLKVDVANNGIEGVDSVSASNYDLVLMDIQMPEMDGVTALKVIRENNYSLGPIIALTAKNLEGDREFLLNQGFDAYIAKPIQANTVVEVLKNALNYK